MCKKCTLQPQRPQKTSQFFTFNSTKCIWSKFAEGDIHDLGTLEAFDLGEEHGTHLAEVATTVVETD